jgi:hypothetical protein
LSRVDGGRWVVSVCSRGLGVVAAVVEFVAMMVHLGSLTLTPSLLPSLWSVRRLPFVCLFLLLSPYVRTHTHTPTPTPTHRHTDTDTQTHTHTHARARARTHTHTHTHTCTRMHTHAHVHTRAHACTRKRKRMHTRMQTHHFCVTPSTERLCCCVALARPSHRLKEGQTGTQRCGRCGATLAKRSTLRTAGGSATS